MRIPAWFINWYHKYLYNPYKPCLSTREACYRSYLKGKRAGLALAEEKYYEGSRTDFDVNP